MFDHMDHLGAIPADSTHSHSADPSSTEAPASSPWLRRARELNAEGDSLYYDARWHQAELRFEEARAVIGHAPLSVAKSAQAAHLSAVATRNLGMLAWFRGDHDKSARLVEESRQSAALVTEARSRWYLDVDDACFHAFQLRSRGEFKLARSALRGLRPLTEHPDTDTYLHLRVETEGANLARLRGEFDLSRRRLLAMRLLPLGVGNDVGPWPAETLPVFTRFRRHFLVVTEVDRLVLQAFAGLPNRQVLPPALLKILAHLRLHGEPQPGSEFRLYDLRDRKVRGWIHWIMGEHRAAEAAACDVLDEARALRDWHTECLAGVLLGAALHLADRRRDAVVVAEQAWTLAERHKYWKGCFFACALGVHLDGHRDERVWHERLRDLHVEEAPAIDSLRTAALNSTDLYAPGPMILADYLDAQLEALRRAGRARGPDADPAYTRIVGLGDVAIPFLLHQVRAGADGWGDALRAATGADPVPPELRGDLNAERAAWLTWAAEQLLATDRAPLVPSIDIS